MFTILLVLLSLWLVFCFGLVFVCFEGGTFCNAVLGVYPAAYVESEDPF